MQQRRLKAYLELIQELLSCPSGEEWIRLRQNEDLVDPGFVQTMEQVANSLAKEGDVQRATFLHNWAGQLHHILSQTTSSPREEKSKAYLDFIQSLLGASPKEQQQLIAVNQDLIGPGLFNMMRQIGAQLAAQGNREAGIYLTSLAEEMRKLWLQQHGFQSLQQPVEATEQQPKVKPASYKQSKSSMQQASATASEPQASTQAASTAKSAKSVADSSIPDPWAEPGSASDGGLAVDGIPVMSVEGAAIDPVVIPGVASDQNSNAANESAIASTSTTDRVLHELNQHLAAIATALVELNEKQVAHWPPSPPRPLWHLEALEQACQAGWILTTDEVEQLIQVKPKCGAKDDHYDRGNWRFVKAGKIGTQVAWRVEKLKLS